MAISKQALLEELEKRKKLVEAPKFNFDEFCFPAQAKFFRSPEKRFHAAVCSRRAGKCREINTLVKTPTGSVKIQDLKPGDKVYGYDNDGQVRICEVTQLHDQGIKEVVDLIWNKQVIATSTTDHKWLAHNTHKDKREVKRLKDFNSRDRIAEEYVPIPGGSKHIKEAYAIGALLGDGCSKESGIVISSNDKEIVEKCAKVLGATEIYKRKGNYSWSIKGLSKTHPCTLYYNSWCRDKYAHEKILDLQEIRTWDRKSQLELLAGLIDTDGSVNLTKDGRLQIRLGMQSASVITTCQMLILDLFQHNPSIEIDNRSKYKNGPVHTIRISNNKYSKRILKELPTITERKKWKPEYESLKERNTNPNFTGFKTSSPRKAQCYDITINNDSHLFLDANGLIGHNTVGIVADMLDTAESTPEVNLLYITVTQQAARAIIWNDLVKTIDDYKINCKIDNNRLTISFPNKSKIYIAGAKDRMEIEKYRGWKLKKCYIDEAQSFRSYIKELINDVIIPALRDLKGELYLTGTPGPVLAGTFYEYTTSPNWDNHHWTAFDNPHMHDLENDKDLEETLAEERVMRGISENDPSYIRETYGKWVEDTDSLVFKFNKAKNIYQTLPTEGRWTYIMGVDVGYNDADAIAIIGYNHLDKRVYIIDEFTKNKQNISELVKVIKRLQSEYEPVKIVMDAGALGKKIQEEIRSRHGVNIHAADKNRKVEFIELLNDDLRTGRLLAPRGSLFEEDCMLVTWDKDSLIRNPERPKISDTYHSDINDAVLYAWREARHYLSERPKESSKQGTNEYMDQLEELEAEKMQRKVENPQAYAMEQAWEDDMDALESIIDLWDL
jgi:DNA-binding transcriptional regulator WhiA